ncbi:YlbF family regulator [Vagococcus xieshaowenii]|uniref:Cell fate regulator YmcA, YheA/YmcA/DUF963 family (Controls sporulation, competence, biofilm development) n=2 Tax=Vagococcus xieshaowenii TaxID=2562451 RepID=A0AAJ5JKW1_9ENTE|nr:YlbF family regulator [Vagococcus xieshaowenii]QCA29625.1 hypothetical protein E4Z98_08550 [Vagococcus xieshaowenii]TFZ39372.1 hypothetical protein E4031_09375 [Vagococcus xieshaowenii]
MEQTVEAALQDLLAELAENPIIIAYKAIEDQAKNHPKLLEIAEAIKHEQKQAVKFAHYGKPIAEREAIKKADVLMKEFEEHPLVVTYRQRLIEANDLLQYVTNLVEKEVNIQLALKFENALNLQDKEN